MAPTLGGLVVALVSIQMLMGRRRFWLPDWLLRRCVEQEKLCKSVESLRRPARFIDALIKRRLTTLIEGPARTLIAVLCLLIATCMPVLELVPFSTLIAGVALTLFGLAMVSDDGLLALIGYLTTGAGLWIVLPGLLA